MANAGTVDDVAQKIVTILEGGYAALTRAVNSMDVPSLGREQVSSEISELLTALREPDWGKKTEALRTLTAKLAAGEISEQHEEVMVPSIVAAAKDAKWEVQKAAAVALSELRYADVGLVQSTLEGLALHQQIHYVKEAADQDSSAFARERSGRKSGNSRRTRATQRFSTS